MDTDNDGHIDVVTWVRFEAPRTIWVILARAMERQRRGSPVDVPMPARGVHRGRPREQARGKGGQARARGQAGQQGDRGIYEGFQEAARKCFQMIDKDGGGTLSTDEIVTAVKEDKVAHAASARRALQLRGLRGTAVFVCLVCGGAGSNDRVTLRPFAGRDPLPEDVRGELAVFARARAPSRSRWTTSTRTARRARRRRVARRAASSMVSWPFF